MSNLSPCPRLIEVALPIREISAESVRQKSAQRGHISTLHLWWARRPLAASRAVVFASLVPDPDDPRCPDEFKRMVEVHLKTNVPLLLKSYRRKRNSIQDDDPYSPYDNIPDTLRNRLLMFVAKWSAESIAFEKGERDRMPDPAFLLDDRSLAKWETNDPDNIQGRQVLTIARDLIHAAYPKDGPTVLDLFAGGGSIPLESMRLGSNVIANDYSPVAALILYATCVFPQRYGKPACRPTSSQEFGQIVEFDAEIPNMLLHDLRIWSDWIVKKAEEKISNLYPRGRDGRRIIGYLWVRTATCSNPSCKGEIPLLRTLAICDKRKKRSGKYVALRMEVDKDRKNVDFAIAADTNIGNVTGTKRKRGPAMCPFCEQPTSEDALRLAGSRGQMGERMVAAIVEDDEGKAYRPIEEVDLDAFAMAAKRRPEPPPELILPEISRASGVKRISNSTGIRTHLYGMDSWGSLFNPRQLIAMNTFVDILKEAFEKIDLAIEDVEYRIALHVYLALWLSRNASRMTNVGRWNIGEETVATPFSVQGIPMKWDYPEVNPFSNSSGGFSNSLDFIEAVIKRESNDNVSHAFCEVRLGDAAELKLTENTVHAVVTDPPYFDEMAYADLSDFFYTWLKRTLQHEELVPLTMPQTPKREEATALRHRHGGSEGLAEEHFVRKLTDSFSSARRAVGPDGIVTIMFAHQDTKAWSALVHSILGSGLNITATWPIETERKNRPVALDASALETSITVACRPRVTGSAASLREVRKEIEKVVQESVKSFWEYGFRGADLIVACYGPAVGVFGKYERVEKGDGTPVNVPELLDLARAAARDAIAGEFHGDNFSTLYYVWANLYGASEQAWDDARLVVQIGGDADSAMEVARGHGIFVVDGSKCRLALLKDRANRRGLGTDPKPPLIDALHRAMLYWKEEKRGDLVSYLNERGLLEDGPFWKLAQALFEVLPRDQEDWKLVSALLGERNTLRTEARSAIPEAETQQRLFEE